MRVSKYIVIVVVIVLVQAKKRLKVLICINCYVIAFKLVNLAIIGDLAFNEREKTDDT